MMYHLFLLDAALPFWAIGGFFLLIALAVAALVTLIILFIRRKNRQKP